MSDKDTVEMTPQEFRKAITEMVRVEIARHILESDEGDTDSTDPEVFNAKMELLDLLKKRTAFGRSKGADISNKFLKFLGNYAQEKNLESLKNISSLEDFADRLSKNYAQSRKWDRAKKYVEELINTYLIKGWKMEKDLAADQSSPNKVEDQQSLNRAESILQSINSQLSNRIKYMKIGDKQKLRQKIVKLFSQWLKTTYPELFDQDDDSVATLVKYADYFSQTIIPTNRTVNSDLNLFFASNFLNQLKMDKEQGKEEKQKGEKIEIPKKNDLEIEDPQDKKRKRVSSQAVKEIDGVKLEDIGKEMGVSKEAINIILTTLPAGKVNALYNILKSFLENGRVADTKRTLEMYNLVIKRAIEMAVKEFIHIIEDADEKSFAKGDELNLVDLVSLLESMGLRNDLTPEEKNVENQFLSRIIEVIIEEENTDWKSLVGEMLKTDLLKSKNNMVKSFQNLVSQAVGLVDLASWKKTGAGRMPAELKSRAEKAKELADQLGATGRVRPKD